MSFSNGLLVSFFCVMSSMLMGCPNSMTVQMESSSNCVPGPGVSGTPKNIEEAVTLINSLPKPVTVECFVESLDRPLKVALTNSEASAQPAAGTRSPRVFIFSDSLIISIVPDGRGSKVVEFSVLLSSDKSIKGEVPFPIQGILDGKTPYDHIRDGNGTLCAACHGIEQQAPQITFTKAFISKAFQPNWQTDVDLDNFRKEVLFCDPKVEPERCRILEAIFGHGEVRKQDFPADMPAGS
ncbi:hypothetical protein D3C87_260340 [compost metagenome]